MSKAKVTVTYRIDVETYEWLKEKAVKEDRSVNAQVNRILAQARQADGPKVSQETAEYLVGWQDAEKGHKHNPYPHETRAEADYYRGHADQVATRK